MVLGRICAPALGVSSDTPGSLLRGVVEPLVSGRSHDRTRLRRPESNRWRTPYSPVMRVGRTLLSSALLLLTACAPSPTPPLPTPAPSPTLAPTPAPSPTLVPSPAPSPTLSPTLAPIPTLVPTLAPTPQPRQPLQPVVDGVGSAHEGTIGIVVKDLTSGDTARLNDGSRFRS